MYKNCCFIIYFVYFRGGRCFLLCFLAGVEPIFLFFMLLFWLGLFFFLFCYLRRDYFGFIVLYEVAFVQDLIEFLLRFSCFLSRWKKKNRWKGNNMYLCSFGILCVHALFFFAYRSAFGQLDCLDFVKIDVCFSSFLFFALAIFIRNWSLLVFYVVLCIFFFDDIRPREKFLIFFI